MIVIGEAPQSLGEFGIATSRASRVLAVVGYCSRSLADVRFAPKADKQADISVGPLCAMSRHARAGLLDHLIDSHEQSGARLPRVSHHPLRRANLSPHQRQREHHTENL